TSGDQWDPRVVSLPSGEFLVTWNSQGTDGSGAGVYGRSFDSTGVGIGDQFQIHALTTGDQWEARVAVLSGARFAVTWESNADGNDRGISARLFEPKHPANDFNGDHRSDILWRNDNGQFGDWLADANGNFVGNPVLTGVSADWKIVGTGDF